MKYLVIALAEKEEIFMFPRSVDHHHMADACLAIRFGDQRNWTRKYHGGKFVAAGFFEGGVCHGADETLGLSSRGQIDADLLNKETRKYIVIALADNEEIFTFPRNVDHDRMAEACETIRFESPSGSRRKYRQGEIVSAGFVDGGACNGRSETLGLSSRAKVDTNLLAEASRPIINSPEVFG